MELFVWDKGEGIKKVIVVSDSVCNYSFRVRLLKSLSFQRYNKNCVKIYNGYYIINSNIWQRGLVNLIVGNVSMEKIFLGYYRSGNNLNNLYFGIYFDYFSNFLLNFRIVKFNVIFFFLVFYFIN